jgi:NitT/TauT family transport system substrate-binding protein
MSKNSFFVFLIFVALTLGLTSCSKVDPIQKVTMRANFLISGEHAPFFLGIDKGFFREEGIDLEIIPSEGSSIAVQIVGTGKEDFGLASSEIVLIGRAKDIPVKSILLLNPKSPVSIFSLKEKNISSPADLAGKKIGVILKSNTYQQFQVFLKKEAIEKSSFEEVPTTSNVENILNGKIDALVHQTHKGAQTLKSKGFEINEIMLEDYGVHFYGLTLITNDNLINNNPGLIKKFARATRRSWEYALVNREESIQALVKYNPGLDYNLTLNEFSKFNLITEKGKGNNAFHIMKESEWESAETLLFNTGIIEKKGIAKYAFTNEFQ